MDEAAAAAADGGGLAELLSVMKSEEQEERAMGDQRSVANGHTDDQPKPGPLASIRPSGTSYWSITEGTNHPHLLSPAPGPSGRKSMVQKASRPGLSRIPGRDHRRYYHEYWRSEYLMDFDPERSGMICMVCGSSLATLKLSTIKRHIRQKHPDSLLWSPADKEVIRSGWESHLGLGGGQGSYGPGDDILAPQDDEDALHQPLTAGDPSDSASPGEEPPPPSSLSPPPVKGEPTQPKEEGAHLPGPSAQTLERYLNDSLHAWFRQEFLMEYEAQPGRLLCMVCGAELPSLHLDHIKSHVLDTHPNSLVYSSEEKHCILQAWAQTHEEAEDSPVLGAKEGEPVLYAEDMETSHLDAYAERPLCGVGSVGSLQQEAPPLRPPRRRRLHGGDPWRLRLDYLVAYGPRGQGTFCMVCSQLLKETKVSSFRRHIQESHPETTTLSREVREAMAAAWTKDCSEELHIKEETRDGDDLRPTEEPTEDVVKKEECEGKGKWTDGGPRHGHYPGKDQRRNYQVRWRMDYLMDYDCRRHGLICMVCGATLATLKVSTIKRHIQQVHPYSLDFSPEQRQQALLSYSQHAPGLASSDD